MDVLFICRANAIRSQIAEAFYNHHATEGRATSAGVDLTNSVQGSDLSLLAMVHNLIETYGIDSRLQRRNWLTENMVERVDVVVVLTDYSLPDYVRQAKKLVDWSDIPDIVSASKDEQVAVCKEIDRRVGLLHIHSRA